MAENDVFQDTIVAKTIGELGSFLDELAHGTSRYRTVHNLTEQIEHQYAGRFAIELIQNAHDPIAAEPGWGAGQRRIELVLEASGPHGTLFVANDGRPFRDQDFESLSNLGQSSKDPNEAIGNKGIGFRSVLEVSRAPEIYSCQLGSPGMFHGYCFRFDPDVLFSFETVIEAVLAGDDDPTWRHDGFGRLVGGVRGEAFRARARAGLNPRDELRLLSPYSLPIPTVPTDQAILEFAHRGFATVVRLPLSDEGAREKVEHTLGALSEKEVVFLEHVGSLTISTAAGSRTYRRDETRPSGALERRAVTIEASGSDKAARTFWIWRGTFGVVPEGAPVDHPARVDAERLIEAVTGLPGNWKKLKEAPLAIAVEPSAPPSPGLFYIHLPTEQQTGVGAHLHAPFYGDMSRKAIDSREPLNRVLLDGLADLANRVVEGDLLGGGVGEGAAILDLTAKIPNGGPEDRWRTALTSRGTYSLPLLHTDQGWRDASQARLLVVPDGATVLTREQIRAHAAFAALSELLTSRAILARALIEEHRGSNVEPTQPERAETVQAIARALHAEGETDWAAFLSDVKHWVSSARVVAKKRILRDRQNVLRAADPGLDEPRIFFAPVRGGERTRDIEDVPVSLRSRINFLSSDLPLLDVGPDGRRRRTDLANWLQEIVEEYSVDTILSRVLVPALPGRASGLSPDEQQRCRDVLDFTVRLVQLAEGETSLVPHLKKLRLPCRGGWYEATEAIAGPDWSELGAILHRYLQAVETAESRAARERTLLSPDDPVWGSSAPFIKARVAVLGIADGLLPIEPPASWSNRFDMSGVSVAPPREAPPGASRTQWTDYRTFLSGMIRPRFSSWQTYVLLDVRTLPGLDLLAELPGPVRRDFTELVVRSIKAWLPGWETSRYRKAGGQSHEDTVPSFLAWTLRNVEWIWVDDGESGHPHGIGDRWYVPHLTRAAAHNYAHLDPLPPELARHVDVSGVADKLAAFGLPVYRLDEDGAPAPMGDARLLNALARALAGGRVDEAAYAIFLGQVRRAWKWFASDAGTQLPEAVVVTQGTGRPHTVVTGSEEVFLPGSGVTAGALGPFGDLPILCIESADAERLAPQLTARHPGRFTPLSAIHLDVDVAGIRWSPSLDAPTLPESELGWMVPFVLAVSAFGEQGVGTTTKSFRQDLATLRRLRVEQAPRLAVRQSRGGQTGVRSPVAAHLHLPPGTGSGAAPPTLLYDPERREWREALARPFQRLLARRDLGSALQLAFTKLGPGDGPEEPATVASALESLGIDEGRRGEVRASLTEDLEWVVQRLRPLARLFGGAAAVAEIGRARSQEDVERVLEALHPDLGPTDLLIAAREAPTDRDLGAWLYAQIGAEAELDRWNTSLAALGPPYRVIDNAGELQQELQEHRRDLRTPLRALARAVSMNGAVWQVLRDQIEAVEVDAALAATRWTLSFTEAARLLLVPLAPALPARLLEDLSDASDAARFVRVLESSADLSLEPHVDPDQLYAENDRACRRIVRNVVRAAVVWCARRQVKIGGWSDAAALEDVVSAAIARGRGWLDPFDAKRAFAEVRAALPRGTRLASDDEHAALWATLDESGSVGEMLQGLGMTESDLEDATGALRAQEDDARRRKRIHSIAGKEFDTAEQNLRLLWHHIDMSAGPSNALDFSKVVDLEEITKRRAPSPGRQAGHSPAKRSRLSISEDLKNAIALAGEIHVFRWLQATYGEAVTPECWISSLSRYVFPGNYYDDDHGCDFSFKLPGTSIELSLEVKASLGDDDSFELGISETRLAMKLAQPRRRKRKLFRIVHVLNAFSASPIPVPLPNPYEPGAQNRFRIDDTGVRLRYRRRATTPTTVGSGLSP